MNDRKAVLLASLRSAARAATSVIRGSAAGAACTAHPRHHGSRSLALLTATDPGDEVVVPTPAWPNPLSQTELAGATPVEVPLPAEEGFAFDADRVIDAMTDRTGAVVLTSPSNPTGRVFDVEEMERVVAAAAERDAYVVADEVYHELVYEESRPRLAAATDHPERVVTIGSCSKTYAMTGWRVGWLAGPTAVTRPRRRFTRAPRRA